MPIFIGALIGALVQALGTFVGKVLISLGLGYAVFTGVDTSITFARDFVLNRLASQGGIVVSVASTLKLGVVISMLTSALVTRLTINGLTGGTLRRMVQK
ncbi:MAG: DUF2523 domain-containing protein [Oxalobacteraceae bacterium]|nr:MAG: DUF2523 domain-containing protein [Oxalobacteraceae bacterium]